jgi:hypothetical protein
VAHWYSTDGTLVYTRSVTTIRPYSGVLAYLYYERTKPVVKIDVPGVSGEITKEGVDIEVGKSKSPFPAEARSP